MSSADLWLLPLAISALISLFMHFGNGLRWSWGYCLQQGLIFFLAASGFLFGETNKIVLPSGFIIPAKALILISGWSLFLFFNIVQRRLMFQVNYSLGLMKIKEAQRQALLLKSIAWGPPGQYWYDITLLLKHYVDGDNEQAEKLLAKWRTFHIPKSFQESLAHYAMLGKLIQRNWLEALADFQSLLVVLHNPTKTGLPKLPYLAGISASRAYAELGDTSRSFACLELIDIAAGRLSKEALDTIFLSFFALAGWLKECELVASRLKNGRVGLPDYACDYWLGRCYMKLARYTEAKNILEEAFKNGQTVENWAPRIKQMIEQCNLQLSIASTLPYPPDATIAGHINGKNADKPVLLPIAPAREDLVVIEAFDAYAETLKQRGIAQLAVSLLSGSRKVIDLLDSRKSCPAVLLFAGIIIAVSLLIGVFRSSGGVDSQLWINGVLIPQQVMVGEVWRLLTYNFLHGGLSHLAMNLIGLLWLGRHVETLFGTRYFVFIYLISGIAGGIAHILLSPDLPAVGASASVLGVFGAGAAALSKLQGHIPERIRSRELKWMLTLAFLQFSLDLTINMISAVGGHGVRIAQWAHAGGMLAGVGLGFWLPVRKEMLLSEAEIAQVAEPEKIFET